MKPFLSWLLIVILSFNCIGGYLCFKIDFSREVESVMNEVEKAIADAMKEEMGLDIHVEIIPEDQLNVEGLGYSGQFIFSKAIDGKTYHYQINSNPTEIVHQEYLAYQHQYPEGGTEKMIFFKRVFSKFTVQDHLPSITGELQTLPASNYLYTNSFDIFQPSIPTPPPEWV